MSKNSSKQALKKLREAQTFGVSRIDQIAEDNQKKREEEQRIREISRAQNDDSFVEQEEVYERPRKQTKPNRVGLTGVRAPLSHGRSAPISKREVTVEEDQNNEDMMNSLFKQMEISGNDTNTNVSNHQQHPQQQVQTNGGRNVVQQQVSSKVDDLDGLDDMLDDYQTETSALNSYAGLKKGTSSMTKQSIPVSRARKVLPSQSSTMQVEVPRVAQAPIARQSYDPKQKLSLESLYFNECAKKQLIEMGSDSSSKLTNEATIQEYNDIDEDGDEVSQLRFYWLDMASENRRSELQIFGKVFCKTTNKHHGALLLVKNFNRRLYFIKKEIAGSDEQFKNNVIQQISKNTSAKDINIEINIVKKRYCFELDVPRGEVTAAEVTLPFRFNTDGIPQSSTYYKGVFGTTHTMIESIQIYRNLMGPGWLKIQNYKQTYSSDKTHCPFLIEIDDFEDLAPFIAGKMPPVPPIVTMYLSVSSDAMQVSDKRQITMVSVLVSENTNVEIVSPDKLRAHTYCNSFNIENRNKSHFNNRMNQVFRNQVSIFETEYLLLSQLLFDIKNIDPDVIVGHGILENLDLLFSRFVDNKIVGLSMMSKLTKKDGDIRNLRLKYKQHKIDIFTQGRLICDTFSGAKEVIREVEFSLEYLSNKMLNIQMKSDGSDVNHDVFTKSVYKVDSLFQKCHATYLICQKLQLIQLTKQLTNVAGCLWSQSFKGKRAERNEMLLMHRFHSKNYILPDKYQLKGDRDQLKKKTKKYKGGMVIAPKSGLQENFTLLLDFNSLYPSIIREYKLCFTTVKRTYVQKEFYTRVDARIKSEDLFDTPENLTLNHNTKQIDENDSNICLLPNIVGSLISQRKNVKRELKKEKDPEKKASLDIKQQALKLVANSIYGCLGFSNSRFYARDIAAMITYYGRNILQKAADKVEEMGFDVVYGDTDSVMINSKNKDILKALQEGVNIKTEINKIFKKKILEIEIDGVFKHLLLHTKKKYAAYSVLNFGEMMMNPQGIQPIYGKEVKGLDIVRRDWSGITKHAGNAILDLILSDSDLDSIYTDIYQYFEGLADRLKSNKVPLEQFIIYRELKKSPKQYKSGAHPHVKVARDLAKAQKRDEDSYKGHSIPYIMCKIENSDKAADKAFHPTFIEANNMKIDLQWYAENQICNPIFRILEHIGGIDGDRIAKIMGAKSSRIATNLKLIDDEPEMSNLIYPTNSKQYVRFEWRCQNIEEKTGKICDTLNMIGGRKNSDLEIFCCHRCKKSANQSQIINQLGSTLREIVSSYYSGQRSCSGCQIKSKGFSLVDKCQEDGCDGTISEDFSELIANGNLDLLMRDINIIKKANNNQMGNESLLNGLIQMIKNVMARSNYEKIDLKPLLGSLDLGVNIRKARLYSVIQRTIVNRL